MTGFTICADDSLIGSQPSPGYGQLAMGKMKKASAPPMLIKTLSDLFVLRTGQGYMHNCFIVRDQSENDRAAIEKFPTMEFDVSEDVEEEEPVTKKSKGKGAANKKTATKPAKGAKAS